MLKRRWTLLAGLTSALLVFWIDAQVNIPVLTTRLISFGIAALILVMTGAMTAVAENKRASSEFFVPDSLWVWSVSFSLVAGCASFLPVVFLDATMQAQDTERWWLRIMPMLALLVLAALAGWSRFQKSQDGAKVMRSWLTIGVAPPLLYAAGQLALTFKLGLELGFGDVLRISIATFAAPVFICGMCLAFAVLVTRRDASTKTEPRLASNAFYPIFALVASVVLSVAILDWRATRADIASRAAEWAFARQPAVSEQLVEQAIALMPHEQVYRRQLIFDLIGRAVADIQQLGGQPARYATVERNLRVAETQARETQQMFPRDPWAVLALANVLQVQALRLLRPMNPAGGLRATLEANQLFDLAHQMFPAQPLVFRNWAQLMFDQGNVRDAYLLLDLMEKLVPNELEPYAERITMARQVSDFLVVSSTLERARPMLDKKTFSQLQSVAGVQHN